MIKVGNVEGEVDCSIHHDGEPQDTDVLRSEVQGSRKIKPTKFDPACYLDDQEVMDEYIRLARLSGDEDLLASAQNDVSRAHLWLNLSTPSRPGQNPGQ
jgi:WD40 repeat protein